MPSPQGRVHGVSGEADSPARPTTNPEDKPVKLAHPIKDEGTTPNP
ncbi:MAG: hypothetical protein ACTHY7_08775 [Marinobacter sp.]